MPPLNKPGLRRTIPRIIGEKPFGVCQFVRDTLRGRRTEGLAFNGQAGRQSLFVDLIGAIHFDEIVETGTFRGDTTAFMAQRSGLNLFTSEYSARNFGYSQARFALERKVHVKCSDSREFLRAHFGKHGQSETTSFVYLDAHWGPDLPLFEETRILFALSSSVVIMIDDFQVPDDPGYAFDSYGPAETLNLQYLRLGEFPTIRVFFPTLPSSREDGARRGCVVLAQDPRMTEALQKIDSLRAWYRP